MKPAAAAEIGRQALIWLAGQPETMAAFLDASGADPAELRTRIADPEFLGFILDFLLQSDELVLGFAAEAGIAPETPARARAALPGGAIPDWT